jgi:NADH:ubiquinone oxidoreductase subunit C
VANGELTVHAKAADVVSVARFLRDHPVCQFVDIIDVTVDWPSREKRRRRHHFLSSRLNQRVH